MKKILVAMMLLLATSAVSAETVMMETDVNMANFWQKNGKDAQKIITVARNITHANGLRRSPVQVYNTYRVSSLFGQVLPNANTDTYNKSIYVHTGLLPYFDNDDELAFVLGHEIAHAQEAYGGVLKLAGMKFNSKKYEYKSDLRSIDYMVKAGYNPVAAILVADKIFGEPLWDWGFTSTHPKGSKRMLAMYKYIYKKYPTYLNSNMANTAGFNDFLKENSKEISAFKQEQKEKAKKQAL